MENTGGFEVGQLRWARRLEQGAALAAAYVAGGLTVGAAVVAAHVTPLPIALDLAQSGLVLLLVLAVIAGLIHRAVCLVLRGQRDLRAELARQAAAVEDMRRRITDSTADVIGAFEAGIVEGERRNLR